ncbi:Outer-membrane lipoprotein carrier protein [Serratia symbiotica]|nr:Outer-membrane lipoprotein carrier protein [Serratia symbiotica]
MEKLLAVYCILTLFVPSTVLAAATQNLKNRLSQVNSLQAYFSYTVTTSDGSAVQNGEGELFIKRPNLFNWHITSPDESVLISDGQTLWFYNPFIEQATATWLKSANEKTPLMLIMRNNVKDWEQYQVHQKNDNFELTPKSTTGNLKKFAVSVTDSGTICSFAVVEQDGQRTTYVLKNQKNVSGNATNFTFTPPRGVVLDDQRQ